MKLKMRPLQDEDDYWRIREFLRQVFKHNQGRELSWHVARWDYWWCFGNPSLEHLRVQDVVFLWEMQDGQIAAVLNPESGGEVFLQVHPELRTRQLEDEMISIAEERLAVPVQGSKRRLRVWTDSGDHLRQEILNERRYEPGDWPDHKRRRSLEMPISEARPAEGYCVRALGDVEEFPARSWASWKAFHPDDPDENYIGWDWYYNIQRAPLYRRDLDLVAVAPDEELAAFCTVWFDDVTLSGVFEPVGTAPAHQQHGLGKAVMCEGMRRLKRLGARTAYVSSFTEPAHRLYASVGLEQYALLEPWVKEF
jgi:mycothiol synthase